MIKIVIIEKKKNNKQKADNVFSKTYIRNSEITV